MVLADKNRYTCVCLSLTHHLVNDSDEESSLSCSESDDIIDSENDKERDTDMIDQMQELDNDGVEPDTGMTENVIEPATGT